MTGSALSKLLQEMPGKTAAALAPAVDRLFELEDEIAEQILGIGYVELVNGGDGPLVVTPNRLILVASTSGLRIVSFSEVDTIVMGPGSKKLFGGYGDSYMMVYRRVGDMMNFVFRGDHAWDVHTISMAKRAHETYLLKTT